MKIASWNELECLMLNITKLLIEVNEREKEWKTETNCRGESLREDIESDLYNIRDNCSLYFNHLEEFAPDVNEGIDGEPPRDSLPRGC